jgi:hypothetical protein
MTPEKEAKDIAALWNRAVDEYNYTALGPLHTLLKTPSRDALDVMQYLDDKVAPALAKFFTLQEKRVWFISESESKTAEGKYVIGIKEADSKYVCEVLPDNYWLLFRGQQKLLTSAAEVLAQAPQPRRPSFSPFPDTSLPDKSTEMSTKSSVERVMGPPTAPSTGSHRKETPSRMSTGSVEPSASLFEQAMSGTDNALLQRYQQLEEENLQLRRLLATKPGQPDSRGEITMEDSTDERVFPMPNDWFANEVMRLVHSLLALCPEPVNTYTCRPIEGGSGLVVAGFCRFDHESRVLKIHKDWLLIERMKQDRGRIVDKDSRKTDLLCETLLALWDVLKLETPDSSDQRYGHSGWTRCRAEIRRRIIDYQHMCRQLSVPEQLRKHGALSVLANNLSSTRWASKDDKIHMSVHSTACPWRRRLYTTWKGEHKA